jgi:hypothetical protein
MLTATMKDHDSKRRGVPFSLFQWHQFRNRCINPVPGEQHQGTRATLSRRPGESVVRLTRLDEMSVSLTDVPSLTIIAAQSNAVSIKGSHRFDWLFKYCAESEARLEEAARKALELTRMTRIGGTVLLDAPSRGGFAASDVVGRGTLFVDAPHDAPLVVHGSYSAVQARDLVGRVGVTTAHARTTLLDATGCVDAVGTVVDFAGSAGHVTISAEAEINIMLTAALFRGSLVASAQRSVRILVPQDFVTPFRAVVKNQDDFVCRTDFCSRVMHSESAELHHFSYAGTMDASSEDFIYLRSELATVVVDAMTA